MFASWMSNHPRNAPKARRDDDERRADPSVSAAADPVVFLIDDDAAVRDAIETALEAAGIGVASFGSARQFLDAYRAEQRGCLVVDADLAGVEPELLRMLASSEPALQAIITSRRLRRHVLTPALAARSAVLLEKPFGMEELLPLIEAAIAAPSGQD